MSKLIISHNEEGVTITIPYQLTSVGREVNKGYAYDCIGSWAAYLKDFLLSVKKKMEETLLQNCNNVIHADSSIIVFDNNKSFSLSTYYTIENVCTLLSDAAWRTILTCHSEFIIRLLLSANQVHPVQQGGFDFEELVAVLNAADHDNIELQYH